MRKFNELESAFETVCFFYNRQLIEKHFKTLMAKDWERAFGMAYKHWVEISHAYPKQFKFDAAVYELGNALLG